MRLIRRLLARRRTVPRLADPERLQQIYRETHRRVEELRRAA
ncbi:MAG TPA: hypothetical protein VIR14_10925 [Gaiellaceae bacterium]